MPISFEFLIESVAKDHFNEEINTVWRHSLKNACGLCNKNILQNQAADKCLTCKKCIHNNCNAMDTVFMEKDCSRVNNEKWECLKCTFTLIYENIPFMFLNNQDLENLNKSDTMRFFDMLPRFNIASQIPSLSNASNDIDDIADNIDSKYYPVHEFQNLKIQKSFNIFHSNVNGLDTHFDNLHDFLSNSSTPSFDIINITETSQRNGQNFKTNVTIEGYDLYHTETLTAKGGTATFIKNSYDTFERDDLKIKHNDFESTWIEIKNKNSKNIISGCIYRHPRYDMQEFLQYLDKTLTTINKENKEIYISGDFNADFLKIEKNKNYEEFYNLITSNGFLPRIVRPTRVTENSATIIDNIFSNNFKSGMLSGNLMLCISEHFSQFLSIGNNNVSHKNVNIYGRNYSKFNSKDFRDDIYMQKWENNLTDVNELYDEFITKLNSCVDKHAPIKKLTKKEIKMKSKPWITVNIRKLIDQRNKLFNRKKRQLNNSNIKTLYNIFRNRVNREVKKAKKEYYKIYFEENKNSIQKTWIGIKEIINTKSAISPRTSQLKINGQAIDDALDISNCFNNFFVNVGPTTENEIPGVNRSPESFLKDRNNFNFLLKFVSNDEIITIIKNLNSRKSSGPSSIPTKLLILIPDIIVLPLCKIINTSFSTGIFPEALKIAKVIPIYKKGSTQDVNNYRPISLLSIFDKIIEKIMYNRVNLFLENHNILFEQQYGFRKQMSTHQSLINITEKIKNSIEKGKYGCGVFIDLKKAFDTVNHVILFKKLDHYGIRGNALDWFKSYLTNRKQYSFFNGVNSELKDISCGVPQGSVLGPLLFLIYINDIPNVSQKLQFFLFADDTNIYYEASTIEEIENVLNTELDELYKWLCANRLSLNISKTNYLVFHPYNKPMKKNITIRINEQTINEEKYVKYLGVLIDTTLSWKFHVIEISKKIARSIGILYKIRPYVSQKIMISLYNSLVYPHLIYAIHVWGSTFKTNLNSLVVLQKKVVRLITYNDGWPVQGYKLAPSSPLFRELEILKISEIFKHQISKFIHNCINNKPIQFKDWFLFTTEMHRYYTRSNASFNPTTSVVEKKTGNIYIPYARTTNYGQKSIKIQGSKIWNEIPFGLRNITSKILFAKSLKLYYNSDEYILLNE